MDRAEGQPESMPSDWREWQRWTENADWPLGPSTDPEGVLLGKDEFFVMGDNRNHSSDSRMFGFVRSDQIEARGLVRIWPLGQFGIYAAGPRLSTARAPALAAA